MKARWRILGTFCLLGVLGWRLLQQGEWDRMAQTFATLSPLKLVLGGLAAAGVFLLSQLISTLRWQLLAGPLGLDGPFYRFLRFYFIGMFFNLVLPTSVGGDVVRAWYLAGEHEGKRSAAVLTVLADRLSGLAILLCLACLAALLCPIPLAPWLAWTLAGLGALTIGAVGLFLLVLGTGIEHRLSSLPWVGSQAERLLGLTRIYLDHPGLLLGTGLLSVLVQLLNVVLAWVVGLNLGLGVPFGYYAIVVPLVTLSTLAPISLNGMGLREWATVVLLAPLGVQPHQAVAQSLLQFLACSAVGLLGSVFYLLQGSCRPTSAQVPEEPGTARRAA